ncbi:hypothetical protein ACGF8B_11615 [Streptomyces sp. NPDC047917]|uniref:hypothetical protein n=1 Tax=Streptomyces sp. NPDC047917 TaxID=3365491 RepID=UPI003717A516
MVHPDDGLIPWPQDEAGEAGDELPVDLPGRWPLFGLYVVFLSPNPAVLAEGGFLHLEWDESQQRAALRIATDTEAVAGLERLDVRSLLLVGETILEAARGTVRAVPRARPLLRPRAVTWTGRRRCWPARTGSGYGQLTG